MPTDRNRKPRGPRTIRHFHTKVVGVTKPNHDGTSRQRIIKGCTVGDPLWLVRLPGHPHDKNAIAVMTTGSQHIGWLNREVAEDLAPLLDHGFRVTAVISDLTGGGWLSKRSRGVNLEITKYPKEKPEA